MKRPFVVSWLTVILVVAVLFAGCGLVRVVTVSVFNVAGGG